MDIGHTNIRENTKSFDTDTQIRINGIIDNVHKRIDAHDKFNDKLKEDYHSLFDEWLDGHSLRDMAQKRGISRVAIANKFRNTIYKWIQEQGVEIPHAISKFTAQKYKYRRKLQKAIIDDFGYKYLMAEVNKSVYGVDDDVIFSAVNRLVKNDMIEKYKQLFAKFGITKWLVDNMDKLTIKTINALLNVDMSQIAQTSSGKYRLSDILNNAVGDVPYKDAIVQYLLKDETNIDVPDYILKQYKGG